MPIYNKTALKKVKKDELIQMFLDLQAQRINDSMDEAVEKCCTNAIEEVVEGLKAENEKLKKANKKYHMNSLKLNRELDDWHKALNEPVEGLENLQSGINLHFWQRCSGPWDADIEKINQK
tara:strand:- start:12149 stop:12511 length:363 start_codon:yes stop_codon:yes gene_type:complete